MMARSSRAASVRSTAMELIGAASEVADEVEQLLALSKRVFGELDDSSEPAVVELRAERDRVMAEKEVVERWAEGLDLV